VLIANINELCENYFQDVILALAALVLAFVFWFKSDVIGKRITGGQ